MAQSITQHRWDVIDYPAGHGSELQVEGGRCSIHYGEVKAGDVVKGRVVCPVRLKPNDRPAYELSVIDKTETRSAP